MQCLPDGGGGHRQILVPQQWWQKWFHICGEPLDTCQLHYDHRQSRQLCSFLFLRPLGCCQVCCLHLHLLHLVQLHLCCCYLYLCIHWHVHLLIIQSYRVIHIPECASSSFKNKVLQLFKAQFWLHFEYDQLSKFKTQTNSS